ncbi:unnamed protein product [Calypogeia fissa]
MEDSEERSNAGNASSAATPPQRTLFAMAKGDGEDSYSKNSQFQAIVTEVPRAALDEMLEKLTLPSGTVTVRVADLGSASGPNTIASIAHIVAKLRDRVPKDAEFQAYFNDVPSNDFNNLFQLLSSDSRARTFFSAGAPGSFFYRIFPKSSVHVFYSAFALHWLSKVPDAVLDKHSPAYNKGKIWYQHSQSAVARSFQQQALLDLKNFFVARAAELVSGGLLFLVFNGRETSKPHECDGDITCNFQSDFGEVFSGLVAEGLVTEQRCETFNLPVYHHNGDDIREALACCGSMFKVDVMKLHKTDFCQSFVAMDTTALARQKTITYRAALNPLLEAHFGVNIADAIWQRFEQLVKSKFGRRPDILTQWILALTRN